MRCSFFLRHRFIGSAASQPDARCGTHHELLAHVGCGVLRLYLHQKLMVGAASGVWLAGSRTDEPVPKKEGTPHAPVWPGKGSRASASAFLHQLGSRLFCSSLLPLLSQHGHREPGAHLAGSAVLVRHRAETRAGAAPCLVQTSRGPGEPWIPAGPPPTRVARRCSREHSQFHQRSGVVSPHRPAVWGGEMEKRTRACPESQRECFLPESPAYEVASLAGWCVCRFVHDEATYPVCTSPARS